MIKYIGKEGKDPLIIHDQNGICQFLVFLLPDLQDVRVVIDV